MRFLYYLETAKKLIGKYRRGRPIASFLKEYYRVNRKMGSTDRKTVSSLVYSYFRTHDLLGRLPLSEHLLAGWFLCHRQRTPLLAALRPEWDLLAERPALEKLEVLSTIFGPMDPLFLFNLSEHLSAGIDPVAYALSMLRQPDLFLRVRPGAASAIREKLRAAPISFQEVSPTCFSLENATSLDDLLKEFSGDYQIQDRSSQLAGDYFRPRAGERWWDACAGSGGKSLLLHDLEPTVKLYATDNRPAMLENLRERFAAAGITEFETRDSNLATDLPDWKGGFDGIIMDVPCSGSGTWGRTPEMMAAFSDRYISNFCDQQKLLVKNVLPFLRKGCPLVYITCSVLREENEELVSSLCQEAGLELEEQTVLKGYRQGADTMFVARLLKK